MRIFLYFSDALTAMVRLVSQLSGVKSTRKKRVRQQATQRKNYCEMRNINKLASSLVAGIVLCVTIGAISLSVAYQKEAASIVLLPSHEGDNRLIIASSDEYVAQKPEVCQFYPKIF